MQLLSADVLQAYWSDAQVEANLLILMNIVGALLLGMLVGYERSYHGRAAGIRTYGLVCMASAAMTVIVGYPHFWFGGLTPMNGMVDPTRVVQGIVTGVGFLGAGVIMKEGLNISGLTTAASIWASSAIGVLCGAGFYCAAIALSVLAATVMVWGGRIETVLPSRHAAAVTLQFKEQLAPDEAQVRQWVLDMGYRIADGATSISCHHHHQEWHLVLLALNNQKVSIPQIAAALNQWASLQGFQVAFARN